MPTTDDLSVEAPSEVSAVAASEISDNARAAAIRAIFVEDDEDFRETLAVELAKHGFAVRGFANAPSLMKAVDDIGDADLILLDWGVAKTSGLDLLTELRGRGVTLPVVFFPGRPLVADEPLALEGDAADFIDKGPGVVTLRSEEIGSRTQLFCGKLTLRHDIRRAYWNGIDLNFTLGEYNIVHLLASNVGNYVTYRAIYDRVRPVGFVAGTGAEGYRSSVRSAIKRIRNKFRELDRDFAEIHNYTAFGYCWGKVARIG